MPEDEGSVPGDLAITMKVIPIDDHRVMLTFTHPVEWIKLTRATALALAGKLQNEALKLKAD